MIGSKMRVPAVIAQAYRSSSKLAKTADRMTSGLPCVSVALKKKVICP